MKNFRIHFIYWILPTLVTLTSILLYFFDGIGLSHIISPAVNREFGILENLQLLLLIIILVIAVRAVKVKQAKTEKYLFVFISIMAVFLLFEEVDYGLHFYELVSGGEHKPAIRNIHNNGKITSHFKMAAYIFIVIFFVLLPLLSKFTKHRYPLLDYITPSKNIIATTISLFLLNQIAFYFYHQDAHSNRSLDGNVSEFEELMIYYIGMLFINELASRSKRLPSFSSRTGQKYPK